LKKLSDHTNQFLSQLGLSGKLIAIIEIVAVLILAALLGYILSKLIARSRLRLLEEELELKRIDLAHSRSVIMEQPALKKPAATKFAKTNVPVRTEPISATPDDLKIIEGIGPKIEEILNKHDIYTYAALAETSPIRIVSMLRSAGPRYQIHDPSSWPKQASLANQGRWQSLEDYKIHIISGNHS